VILATIKHVVVLMLENRSFDHKLGFLKRENPEIDGLTGAEENLNDPSSPLPIANAVSDAAEYVGDFQSDPPHELADVKIQLYGRASGDFRDEPDNSGFVLAYALHSPANLPSFAMRCFAPGRLPAYHTLAREFAVCDRWFASVPGPTWPNRFFVHCASGGGFVDGKLRIYAMRTIFDNLIAAGESAGIYFHDIPQSLMLQRLQVDLFKGIFHEFETFLDHARAGTLPSYSFIEPRYFDHGAAKANDDHPPHDVRLGDQLVAQVYEAVRASPAWESTVLVVLSDEHGGIYDHVAPPRATPPGDGVSADPPFGFDRLGVRVPALVISPWVPRGTVDHHVYDHASIPATLRSVFGLPTALTQRDAVANTFEGLLSLDAPRTDAPLELPTAFPPLPAEPDDTVDLPPAENAEMVARAVAAVAPLSALQRGLLSTAASLDVGESGDAAVSGAAEGAAIQYEHEAARYVSDRVLRHLG
jgi:phospholipase C